MDDRAHRVAERLEAPMLVAAALTVPAIVIEEAGATGGWLTLAHALDWITWAAFAFEMVTMLAVVPGRARWLRDHPLELAIVVLTPPFLPASLATLRVFRLLRLLRLLRLAQLARRVFSTEGLRDAGVILLVTILGGGAAFRAFEQQPLSLWDGVWFAVTTATTVGYGDIQPDTTGAQVIAILIMVLGIGFVALLTAAMAQRFLHVEVTQAEAEAVGALEPVEEQVLARLDEIVDLLRAHGERLDRLERP